MSTKDDTEKPNENRQQRDSRGYFLPGNKGGGRRAISPEVIEVLQAATPAAAKRLVEGLDAMKYVGMDAREVPDWRERREYVCALFDRLYGKPAQSITGKDGESLIPEGAADITLELARRLAETLGHKQGGK